MRQPVRLLSWTAVAVFLGAVFANLPSWIETMQNCELRWPRLGCDTPGSDPAPVAPAVTPTAITQPPVTAPPPARTLPTPTPTAPAPRQSQTDKIEVRRNDSADFCGLAWRVTFKTVGSDLGTGVYLHRGQETLDLKQHQPQAISGGCSVTFVKFDIRSNEYAQFIVSE